MANGFANSKGIHNSYELLSCLASMTENRFGDIFTDIFIHFELSRLLRQKMSCENKKSINGKHVNITTLIIK